MPGALSTVTSPPLCWTMPYTEARPRPTPCSRVVKNGSKTWARVCSSMPRPVSVTDSSTNPSSASRVRMVSLPPSGIASRPLTTRLTSTCSIWPGSARTVPSVGRGEDVQLDVVAEQALQEGADLGHDGVQVERARIQHLAAAEGEQLLRQLGGTVGGALDLAEVAAKLDVVGCPLEQERGVAGDAGEQVVEVVRDASREPAEALELLRAQELRFQPLPLGAVAQECDVQAREEARSRGRVRDHGSCRRASASPIPRGPAHRGGTPPSPPRPSRACAGAGSRRACGRSGRLARRRR